MRVTVSTILNLLASGNLPNQILKAYPYLESADIDEAIAYGACRASEREATVCPLPH
jgi:uncharacterized protein (DUF433 family)